ncbi:MAG: hypothetical protein GX455_06140 [Phycisphaerae bacterium]|nr:hypothetical protein [Phycisphaerae bacterium]
MQPAKSLAQILTILICIGVGLIWLATADSASTKTYEIDADAVVESYSGNADRMIAAYDQLASQYLNLVQNQLNRTSDDIHHSAQKLESIEKKLDALSLRLARIEKALKITDEIKSAPRPENTVDKPVGAESYPAERKP